MLFGLGPAGWFTYPWFTNPYLYMHPRFPYGGPPGYGYGYPMTKEQEKAMLEQDAKMLEGELDRISKRLEELKG